MKRRDVQGVKHSEMLCVKRWEVHRDMCRMKHEDVHDEVHRERRETSSVALPALSGLLLPFLRALAACRGKRHPGYRALSRQWSLHRGCCYVRPVI